MIAMDVGWRWQRLDGNQLQLRKWRLRTQQLTKRTWQQFESENQNIKFRLHLHFLFILYVQCILNCIIIKWIICKRFKNNDHLFMISQMPRFYREFFLFVNFPFFYFYFAFFCFAFSLLSTLLYRIQVVMPNEFKTWEVL